MRISVQLFYYISNENYLFIYLCNKSLSNTFKGILMGASNDNNADESTKRIVYNKKMRDVLAFF